MRAAGLDGNLVTVLNGVLDPVLFANERDHLRKKEKEDQVSNNRDEVLCGMGDHLGRAAINRAMQVSGIFICIFYVMI